MVSGLRGHAPLLLHGDADGLGLLCEHLFALSAAFPPGRLATVTRKAPLREWKEHMPVVPRAAVTSPHPTSPVPSLPTTSGEAGRCHLQLPARGDWED